MPAKVPLKPSLAMTWQPASQVASATTVADAAAVAVAPI